MYIFWNQKVKRLKIFHLCRNAKTLISQYSFPSHWFSNVEQSSQIAVSQSFSETRIFFWHSHYSIPPVTRLVHQLGAHDWLKAKSSTCHKNRAFKSGGCIGERPTSVWRHQQIALFISKSMPFLNKKWLNKYPFQTSCCFSV